MFNSFALKSLSWTQTLSQSLLSFGKASSTWSMSSLTRMKTPPPYIGNIGNIAQEVVVNGSKSECRMVKSGVPHGTVLGPHLFLIYINDIESQITSCIRLFADDCALTDQYNLKVIPFHHKMIYSSCRSGQIHDKWQLMLTNVSYFVSLFACQV